MVHVALWILKTAAVSIASAAVCLETESGLRLKETLTQCPLPVVTSRILRPLGRIVSAVQAQQIDWDSWL